jgi:hypothetical protein
MILAGMALGTKVVSAQEFVRVDNLSESQVGQFPKDWKTYPFHKNRAKRVYKVEQSGGDKFIQAFDSKDISVPIFKDFQWDVAQYPYLKFKWRAMQLPKGSKEVNPATNDSACGVFVGFSRTQALKYVWSDGLSPGSFWDKNPGKYTIISREMGEKNKGQWQPVVVDVPKDFQRYFNKTLDKNPIGIGMLTDGNAVHQTSACDYKDFYISKTP